MLVAFVLAVATPDIVVTGAALPDAETRPAVTVDRERLTGSASGRIEDILRDVPGFQAFRRSDSRSANPTSQGVTLRALGGSASSRALLTLDGVPQTDPFGGWVSWPAYRPERLGAARVTRGAGDAPGALAGTVDLSSARPDDLRGLRTSSAIDSRGGTDLFAGFGADAGAGFVSASAAYARGDGFVPIVAEQRGPVDRGARYDQASLALRGIAPIAGATELQASALLFRDARDRGLPFTRNRTNGADTSLRLVSDGALPWSALAYVQSRDYYNSFASTGAARTTASRVAEQYAVPSTGLGARAELRPRLGPAELTFGGEWRRTQGETRERFNFQNGVGTRGRVAGGVSDTVGGVAGATLERAAWTLAATARADRWRIAGGGLVERVFATGATLTEIAFPDRTGWEPTARADFAWRAAAPLTLRAAAYTGWRLPTLNELYRPFRVGPDATAANAGLAPERLRGIEGGVDWRPRDGARLGATAFSNRLRNAVANVTLGRGPGVFPGVGFVGDGGLYSQRRNLDAIRADGIEIDGVFAAGPWSFSAGYSFVDARVRAVGTMLDGLRPAQTPRHSGSATIAWQETDGLRASVSARYAGAQFENDRNTQRIPGALTFDAAAALPVMPGLALEARGENLAGERVVAGIAGDGTIERATPRTFWFGLRFTG